MVADILDATRGGKSHPDLRSHFFDNVLPISTTTEQRTEVHQHLARLAPELDAWSEAAEAGDVRSAPMYPAPLTNDAAVGARAGTGATVGSTPTPAPTPLPEGRAIDLFTTPFYTVNLLDSKVESDAWSKTLTDFATLEYEKYSKNEVRGVVWCV
jgi:hypothetical protein